MLFSRVSVLNILFLRATCLTIRQNKGSKIETRSGWTFLGCYTDNVSGRALPNAVAVSGGSDAMTNEACQTACLAAGFSYSGTEYAGECCKYLSLLDIL